METKEAAQIAIGVGAGLVLFFLLLFSAIDQFLYALLDLGIDANYQAPMTIIWPLIALSGGMLGVKKLRGGRDS